jgi:hypothetical protein
MAVKLIALAAAKRALAALIRSMARGSTKSGTRGGLAALAAGLAAWPGLAGATVPWAGALVASTRQANAAAARDAAA